MRKAFVFGSLFLILFLSGAGAFIYRLMLADEEETRLKRFTRYEQCLSWKESSSCEYALIGMESFRPGEMTESERQTFKRLVRENYSRDEALAKIHKEREAEYQIELSFYRKWKRGEYPEG